ncbi:peptidase C1B, bleomycin hydrolase [Infundibulicybe gibba]|nr:peptidase C1B, bleomycin hydrolase [Infundibulicybe gibba]
MGSTISTARQAVTTAPTDDEKRSIQVLSSDISSLSLSNGIPMSVGGSIALDSISSWESSAASDPKTNLARTILSHTNIRSALTSRSAAIADRHVFNNVVDFKTGPITNQKSSGRCWIFATTNVLRYNIMKKLSLSEFELSQSYLFFWDKLNKSNYFLELAIQNAHLPIDDRLVNHLSGDLISDGGQWDMSVNLLEGYGMVPQAVFPESVHSSLTSPLNALLKTKLREHSLILRRLSSSLYEAGIPAETKLRSLRAKKEELMKEIYIIITATLGVPIRPDEKFTWDYYDTTGKPGKWEGTPIEYYRAFATKPYPPSDCFSLINDPRNQYSKLYTVEMLGNVWGGRPVLYVNTEIDNMKKMVVKMVKSGLPVFFGCDVGQFSDRTVGIMDPALFEYENAFDITLGLTKAERLQINESAMTHAMVISGVHIDGSGNPVRYKVENSWGDDVGEKGYFVMSDRWFEEFVYQIVVPKAIAPKDLVKVYETGDATSFPPWDPMGTLA